MDNTMLHNLIERLEDELKEVAHKDTMTAGNLEEIDKLVCTIKNLKKIEKMDAEEMEREEPMTHASARGYIQRRLSGGDLTSMERATLEHAMDILE